MHPPPLTSKRALFRWTLDVLRKHSIRPRKKFGQNFVIDPLLIRDILSLIDVDKPLIEVGAGIGTLSYYISRRLRNKSLYIEIDGKLAEIALENICWRGLLIHGDALLLEWSYPQIISNTPYYITSDILVKLARSNDVDKAVLVLQKDVVDRLVAKPGSREYGRITILINVLFDVVRHGVYQPSSFYPKPKVSSQLVLLKRRRAYDETIRVLEELTRKLYVYRRRRAVKVIQKIYGLDESLLEKIGIGIDQRVYELDVGVLLRLVDILKNTV